jgi:hypothetical protein
MSSHCATGRTSAEGEIVGKFLAHDVICSLPDIFSYSFCMRNHALAEMAP